jgi:hypothetical protein
MTGQPHELQPYEPPAITKIGMVHELTLQNNKVGFAHDGFTATTGLVGNIVPASS